MKVETALSLLAHLSAFIAFTCVLQYVHWSFTALFISMFFLSLYRDFTGAFTAPRWGLNLLSIGVLVSVILRLESIYLVEPILEGLLTLVGIKLLEVKKGRDHMQVYLLCLFLLVGFGLLSMSPVFLLYFILLSLLLTISLVTLTHRSQYENLVLSLQNFMSIVKSSLGICAFALPLSAVFFVILPRTPYPIVNLFGHRVESRSGFSDKVSLGEVSSIQLDRSAVFRAVMSPIDPKDLYWRGIVLDEFTGVTWAKGSETHDEQPGAPHGEKVFQTIYLEPHGNRHLFVLDKPVSIAAENIDRLPGLTFSMRDVPEQKIQYTAHSIPSAVLPALLSHDHPYLRLPQDFAPPMRKIVDELLAGSSSQKDILMRLYAFFREGDFSYTLEELPISENPLEEFLLTTRRGNCEYFASALAVMLRMAGIPSRVVGGYRGGDYNMAAGYYLVLQSNAHVWVEAYIPSSGWLRMDPTPPPPPGSQTLREHELRTRLRLALDTFHFYWTRLVINFDLSSQMAMAKSAREIFTRPKMEWLTEARRAVIPAVSSMAVVLALIFLTIFLKNRPPPEKRLVTAFLKRLAVHGYKRSPHEGLEELAARIEDRNLQEKCRLFVEALHKAVYRDEQINKAQAAHLKEMIRNL